MPKGDRNFWEGERAGVTSGSQPGAARSKLIANETELSSRSILTGQEKHEE